jgi:hypothetical protein
MRYPQIRLAWNSTSDEPSLRPRLARRLLVEVRSAVEVSRLAWRRLGARMPWLRQAAKGSLTVAALAVIVMLGINHRADAPARLDLPPIDATSSSQPPVDGERSAPAPWDVTLSDIPTPDPRVSVPHIGFHDLPDLSAEQVEGLRMAGIRGGTFSTGLPSHLSAAIVVTTLALVVLVTTVPGLVRGWHSRQEEGTATDTGPAGTGTDEDEPVASGAEAAEPVADALPDGEASADGNAVELLAANSVTDSSRDLPGPTATGAPDVDDAAGITPGAAGTPSRQDESRPRATAPGPGAVTWPPTGRGPATPAQPVGRHMQGKEAATSRVVLFTATKWGG